MSLKPNKANSKKAICEKPRFIRFKEGAEIYHMSLSKFRELAMAAGATYKINKLVLVNVERFENFLESYRLENGSDVF